MNHELLKNMRGLPLIYEQSFHRSKCKFHLTQTEADILGFLYVYPECDTAKAICEFRKLPKSNVSVAIDRLTKKGYLSHRRDTADRRIVHLTLTEAAGDAVNSIMEDYEKFTDAIFEGFTQDERAAWDALETKMSVNIVNALRKEAGFDGKTE